MSEAARQATTLDAPGVLAVPGEHTSVGQIGNDLLLRVLSTAALGSGQRYGSRTWSSDVDLIGLYFAEIGKTPLLSAEQEVLLARQIEAGLYAEKVLAVRGGDAEMVRQTLWRHHTKASAGTTDTAEQRVERDMTILHIAAANADKYSTAELQDLIEAGVAAKQQFVNANLRLVVSIANRHRGKRRDVFSFLELIQDGNGPTGLVRAVEKFDFTKGNKFGTYATDWIRQAISRGISKRQTAETDGAHKAARTLAGARALLAATGITSPSVDDIAKAGRISRRHAGELLVAERIVRAARLDGPGSDGNGPLADRLEDRTASTGLDVMETVSLRQQLGYVLKRYVEQAEGEGRRAVEILLMQVTPRPDGTLPSHKEIAPHFHISPSRVAQILRTTIAAIREMPEAAELKLYL
ncbi:MAG TPA: sigma-70 family RNA polymerase sigma factor [Candidatus Saccharimonadales bacterium]|nr:sigma-70 family RNA polymerase sigma factor [Candidatus Saccharimonadales bacterium]